jgi:hypothetical protein
MFATATLDVADASRVSFVSDQIFRDLIGGYGDGLIRIRLGQNGLAVDQIPRAFRREYYKGVAAVRLFPDQIDGWV